MMLSLASMEAVMLADPHTQNAINALKPQTFGLEQDRARLTPAALAGMRQLARQWKLTGQDAAQLLGVSSSTWDRIQAGQWQSTLSQDQLTRVSALIGTFKALNLLFAGDMANRWPNLPNQGPLFAGQSPLFTMRDGGIPLMIEVRRYVDALRGGL
jgi:hypothetical protein